MLRLNDSGDNNGDQTTVLQTMLDDANVRKNELETEKIMELEARIEDLQEMTKATVSSNELAELRKKLDEQVSLTQQKDRIIQNERDGLAEVQNQLKSHGEEIRRLREDVERKEEEKRVMREKYNKYFDKARAEAKLKTTGSFYPEVQTLKQQLSEKDQQLQEKDKIIEQLKFQFPQTKNTFEQEEKMMIDWRTPLARLSCHDNGRSIYVVSLNVYQTHIPQGDCPLS
ncbi:hypothetical protein DPMN_084049 [Dreissena polymorpha]|uniref:Hook C-terminal domain-containing protein n=1 Tax=Dreissena polymorpha TaxID=45954 RepID=A0A9D3YA26_DREPO|nr:hypothetical protein DPMN_084049 [Dreissena polymorpha]